MSYETEIEVRFGEVDSYGVVWNGSYPEYLEIARLKLSSAFGLSLEEMKALGVYAPVVEMRIRYKNFLRFGDTFKVVTSVRPTEKAMLTFVYRLVKDSVEIAEAETSHVLLTLEGKMLYHPPAEIGRRIGRMIQAHGDGA